MAKGRRDSRRNKTHAGRLPQQTGMNMNLSAPTIVVFLISVVIAVISLLARYAGMSLVLEPFHWALLAYVVLALGNLLKGL
jgi:cadmium resistance protein CadD (predicted permease)